MYQSILVPFDGSDTSARGLEEAIGLARLTQGRLRVFHVIDEMSFALAMDAYAWWPPRRPPGRPTSSSSARTGGAASDAWCSAAPRNTSCASPRCRCCWCAPRKMPSPRRPTKHRLPSA